MHDIRQIRDAPHAFDAALARRGLPPASPEILALDETRRARIAAAETALAERNAASKAVGAAKARGDEAEFERLRALVAEKKDEIARLEAEAAAADAALRDLLLGIPNLPLRRRARRPRRDRQRRDPPLGQPAQLLASSHWSTTRFPPPAPASTSRPPAGSPAPASW